MGRVDGGALSAGPSRVLRGGTPRGTGLMHGPWRLSYCYIGTPSVDTHESAASETGAGQQQAKALRAPETFPKLEIYGPKLRFANVAAIGAEFSPPARPPLAKSFAAGFWNSDPGHRGA